MKTSKKLVLLVSITAVLLLAVSSAYACGCAAKAAQQPAANTVTGYASQGVHEPGTGIENPEIKQQGTGQGANTVQNATPVLYQNGNMIQQKVQEREHVETQIQQKQQQMNQELQNKTEKQQNVYRNQNQIRLAVHALLAMENLTEGIGPQISAVAREFNNSVQSTIRAEEKIQNRSGFARFFAGGDNEAGQEMLNECSQNQQRLMLLMQYKDECPCDEETKAMLQEQIQAMETENNRLQLVANNEIKSKGLFGWLWKS